MQHFICPLKTWLLQLSLLGSSLNICLQIAMTSEQCSPTCINFNFCKFTQMKQDHVTDPLLRHLHRLHVSDRIHYKTDPVYIANTSPDIPLWWSAPVQSFKNSGLPMTLCPLKIPHTRLTIAEPFRSLDICSAPTGILWPWDSDRC